MKRRGINLFFLILATGIACTLMISCSKGKPVIEWVDVPAGSFIMGSPVTETGRKDDERQHPVVLNGFRMSKNEITVAQFSEFVEATAYITDAEKGSDGYKGSVIWTGDKFEKKNGISWRNDVMGNIIPEADFNHPVVHVSWNDANAFAVWMDSRLPTEAEWEHAARAGTTTLFNTGNCMTADLVNFNGNFNNDPCPKGQYRAKTTPVGTFAPNKFGLCDMHGNVWEWCNDFYSAYDSTAQANPTGPPTGFTSVLRGGSWRDNALRCRSATRDNFNRVHRFSFVGFRIVSLNKEPKN